MKGKTGLPTAFANNGSAYFSEQLSWKSAVLWAQGRGTFEVVSVVSFFYYF